MYIKIVLFCLLIIISNFDSTLRANENQIKPITLRLESGLKIRALPHSELPITAITIIVNRDEHSRFQKYPHLAKCTAELLLRGCRNRSNSQINKTLRSLGTRIEVMVTDDAIIYSCLVLRWDFEVTFDLLLDLLRYPTFEPDEFLNFKNQFRKNSQKRVHYLTNCAASLYKMQIDRSGINSITREDVLAYFRECFRPERVEIHLSGNFLVPGIFQKMRAKLTPWINPPEMKQKQKIKNRSLLKLAATSDLFDSKRLLVLSSGEN